MAPAPSLPFRSHAGGITLSLADTANGVRQVSTALPALIMGIVNTTPDSFWEESRGSGHAGAELALRLVEEGADILDIGAESTRPGSRYICPETEINRLIPVIEEIRRHCQTPISVDTRKQIVMEAAWQAGADILNDVSALEDDPAMGTFAAARKLPVILMHKRGIPATMQKHPHYEDAFVQVDEYLRQRVEMALSLGIPYDRIWLDPGIGFGKDLSANRTLIVRCGQLGGGNHPVVMGLSRKTFVAEIIGKTRNRRESAGQVVPPQQRLAGTLAANLLATTFGASILRVHDVAATRDMLGILGNLKDE